MPPTGPGLAKPKLTLVSLAVLVLIFCLGPLLGLTIQNPVSAIGAWVKGNRLVLYGVLIAVEWAVTGLALLAVRLDGEKWTDIGLGAPDPAARLHPMLRALLNAGIVAGFLVTASGVLSATLFAMHRLGLNYDPQGFRYLIPETAPERMIWIFTAFTAGFCEETMFRGFAIWKLRTVTGNFWGAAVISSVFFGFGHLYQGLAGIVLTGTYGMLFAVLYLWRKQLKPGIYAHFINDAVIGLRPM